MQKKKSRQKVWGEVQMGQKSCDGAILLEERDVLKGNNYKQMEIEIRNAFNRKKEKKTLPKHTHTLPQIRPINKEKIAWL